MSPQDQEALFKLIREAHPHWSPRFCSGYVAGAVSEGLRKAPAREYIQGAHDLDHYSLGVLTGFAIHRGMDAELEPWFGIVSLIVQKAGIEE